MLSFTEPVPLGTWQSSVLISVKLLMFQGDVLFFWQGSVLINVTSILHVGILVSSGIPHEILFKWHPPRNFVHCASCRDAALLDIVALLLLLPALYWANRPDSQFQFAAALSQVF